MAALRVMMEVVLMAGYAYPPSWAALSIWRNWVGVAMGIKGLLLMEILIENGHSSPGRGPTDMNPTEVSPYQEG
jgi:hypothetical protein